MADAEDDEDQKTLKKAMEEIQSERTLTAKEQSEQLEAELSALQQYALNYSRYWVCVSGFEAQVAPDDSIKTEISSKEIIKTVLKDEKTSLICERPENKAVKPEKTDLNPENKTKTLDKNDPGPKNPTARKPSVTRLRKAPSKKAVSTEKTSSTETPVTTKRRTTEVHLSLVSSRRLK